MTELLDISISNKWIGINGQTKKRTRNYRHIPYSGQWPKAHKNLEIVPILNKNWELRNYNPKVIFNGL